MSADVASRFDRAALLTALRRLQPLATLPDWRLEDLVALCVVETFALGSNPFHRQNLDGQSVYLLRGELKLAFDDGSSLVIVGGTESAQRPLGASAATMHGSRAITEVTIVRLDAEILDITMTWDQLVAASSVPGKEKKAGGASGQCETTDWRSMSGAFRVQSLVGGSFSRLPAASIDSLFQRFERIRLKQGDEVMREGDEGDYYYLIESGSCEVTRRIGGVDLRLSDLKAGDAFGEEALLADGRRSATVRMRRAGVLLRLGKQDFLELLCEPLLRRLSWPEAERRVAAGALWLDVRYPSEYQGDRLPGALNVPLSEIRHAIGVLDPECAYVVYCQSGRRSSAAAFLLSQHGYRAACLGGGLRAVRAE